jgi:hypothetical protein
MPRRYQDAKKGFFYLDAPPPCYNFLECHHRAALEKEGKSVCRTCARLFIGQEYPLRFPLHNLAERAIDCQLEYSSVYSVLGFSSNNL